MIDPLGRPHSGYEGDWWPASVVDDFATAFGGGHVPAMWGYPPGGVPPEVVGPDVLPIPHGGGGGGADVHARARRVGGPERERLAVDPAGHRARRPPARDPGGGHADSTGAPGLGGVILIPILEICLVDPPPAGCPTGVPAVFQFDATPVLEVPPGPAVDVVFVDSDRPNVGDRRVHRRPTGTGHGPLLGARRLAADDRDAVVDVVAHAVRDHGPAGQPRRAGVDRVRLPGDRGQRPVGRQQPGRAVHHRQRRRAVRRRPVARRSRRRSRSRTGCRPTCTWRPTSYALPLVPLADLGGGSCEDELAFGGVGYCADIGPGVAVPDTCTRAEVTYALAGTEAESRRRPRVPGRGGHDRRRRREPRGRPRGRGPGAVGRASAWAASAPGLTYHVVLDAIGDDRGILASRGRHRALARAAIGTVDDVRAVGVRSRHGPAAPAPSARPAPHRVVIIGGGFAGLYAAKNLGKAGDLVDVTLIDRRNHHLFQPMLYQVATGALSPGEIAQPLRSIFRKQRNTTVLLGEAIDVDAERARGPAVGRRSGALRHADRRHRRPSRATSGTRTGRRTRRA